MEANPNTHNFSAKIGDEGGLHVTSGLLHFPSQKQTFIRLIFKVPLRKLKTCVYVHKVPTKRREREEQVAFSVPEG